MRKSVLLLVCLMVSFQARAQLVNSCLPNLDFFFNEANRYIYQAENWVNGQANQYVNMLDFTLGSQNFGVVGDATLGRLHAPAVSCSEMRATYKDIKEGSNPNLREKFLPNGMQDIGFQPKYGVIINVFSRPVEVVRVQMEAKQSGQTDSNNQGKVGYGIYLLGVKIGQKNSRGPKTSKPPESGLSMSGATSALNGPPHQETTGSGGKILDINRSIFPNPLTRPRIPIFPGLDIEFNAGVVFKVNLAISYGVNSDLLSAFGVNFSRTWQPGMNGQAHQECPPASTSCTTRVSSPEEKDRSFWQKLGQASGVNSAVQQFNNLKKDVYTLREKNLRKDVQLFQNALGDSYDAFKNASSLEEKKRAIEGIDLASAMRPLEDYADIARGIQDNAQGLMSSAGETLNHFNQLASMMTSGKLPPVEAYVNLGLSVRASAWGAAVLGLGIPNVKAYAGIKGLVNAIDANAGVAAKLKTTSQYLDLEANLQAVLMSGLLDLIYGIEIDLGGYQNGWEGSYNLVTFPGYPLQWRTLLGRLDFRPKNRSPLAWCWDPNSSQYMDDRCYDGDESFSELLPALNAHAEFSKLYLGEELPPLSAAQSFIVSDGQAVVPADSWSDLNQPVPEKLTSSILTLKPDFFLSPAVRTNSQTSFEVIKPFYVQTASGFTEKTFSRPLTFVRQNTNGVIDFLNPQGVEPEKSSDAYAVLNLNAPQNLTIDLDLLDPITCNRTTDSRQFSRTGPFNCGGATGKVRVSNLGFLTNDELGCLAIDARLGTCQIQNFGSAPNLDPALAKMGVERLTDGTLLRMVVNGVVPEDRPVSGGVEQTSACDSRILEPKERIACRLRHHLMKGDCFPEDRMQALVAIANVDNSDILNYFRSGRIQGQVRRHSPKGNYTNFAIHGLSTHNFDGAGWSAFSDYTNEASMRSLISHSEGNLRTYPMSYNNFFSFNNRLESTNRNIYDDPYTTPYLTGKNYSGPQSRATFDFILTSAEESNTWTCGFFQTCVAYRKQRNLHLIAPDVEQMVDITNGSPLADGTREYGENCSNDLTLRTPGYLNLSLLQQYTKLNYDINLARELSSELSRVETSEGFKLAVKECLLSGECKLMSLADATLGQSEGRTEGFCSVNIGGTLTIPGDTSDDLATCAASLAPDLNLLCSQQKSNYFRTGISSYPVRVSLARSGRSPEMMELGNCEATRDYLGNISAVGVSAPQSGAPGSAGCALVVGGRAINVGIDFSDVTASTGANGCIAHVRDTLKNTEDVCENLPIEAFAGLSTTTASNLRLTATFGQSTSTDFLNCSIDPNLPAIRAKISQATNVSGCYVQVGSQRISPSASESQNCGTFLAARGFIQNNTNSISCAAVEETSEFKLARSQNQTASSVLVSVFRPGLAAITTNCYGSTKLGSTTCKLQPSLQLGSPNSMGINLSGGVAAGGIDANGLMSVTLHSGRANPTTQVACVSLIQTSPYLNNKFYCASMLNLLSQRKTSISWSNNRFQVWSAGVYRGPTPPITGTATAPLRIGALAHSNGQISVTSLGCDLAFVRSQKPDTVGRQDYRWDLALKETADRLNDYRQDAESIDANGKTCLRVKTAVIRDEIDNAIGAPWCQGESSQVPPTATVTALSSDLAASEVISELVETVNLDGDSALLTTATGEVAEVDTVSYAAAPGTCYTYTCAEYSAGDQLVFGGSGPKLLTIKPRGSAVLQSEICREFGDDIPAISDLDTQPTNLPVNERRRPVWVFSVASDNQNVNLETIRTSAPRFGCGVESCLAVASQGGLDDLDRVVPNLTTSLNSSLYSGREVLFTSEKECFDYHTGVAGKSIGTLDSVCHILRRYPQFADNLPFDVSVTYGVSSRSLGSCEPLPGAQRSCSLGVRGEASDPLVNLASLDAGVVTVATILDGGADVLVPEPNTLERCLSAAASAIDCTEVPFEVYNDDGSSEHVARFGDVEVSLGTYCLSPLVGLEHQTIAKSPNDCGADLFISSSYPGQFETQICVNQNCSPDFFVPFRSLTVPSGYLRGLNPLALFGSDAAARAALAPLLAAGQETLKLRVRRMNGGASSTWTYYDLPFLVSEGGEETISLCRSRWSDSQKAPSPSSGPVVISQSNSFCGSIVELKEQSSDDKLVTVIGEKVPAYICGESPCGKENALGVVTLVRGSVSKVESFAILEAIGRPELARKLLEQGLRDLPAAIQLEESVVEFKLPLLSSSPDTSKECLEKWGVEVTDDLLKAPEETSKEESATEETIPVLKSVNLEEVSASFTRSPKFSWAQASDPDGIDRYEAAIGFKAGDDSVTGWISLSSEATSYRFEAGVDEVSFKLSPGVDYVINLKAIDGAGTEALVTSKSFRVGERFVCATGKSCPSWIAGWNTSLAIGDLPRVLSSDADVPVKVDFGLNGVAGDQAAIINGHQFEPLAGSSGTAAPLPGLKATNVNISYTATAGSLPGVTFIGTNPAFTGIATSANDQGLNALTFGIAYRNFDVNLTGLVPGATYYIYIPLWGWAARDRGNNLIPNDGGQSLNYVSGATPQELRMLRYGFVASSSGTFSLRKDRALAGGNSDGLCFHGIVVQRAIDPNN